MNFKLPRIYPITDTRIAGISHAAQVERMIAVGAELIQLREKHDSPRDFYASAAEAIQIAKKHGVRIIINDRVDIAFALSADGVHLGQDDLPPVNAREILGPDAIIGYSTHSVRQAQDALSLPVDYVAIGPIFHTGTKENHHAPLGLTGLHEVRGSIGDASLVAIGGITRESLKAVFDAGADSVAMIGGIVSDPAKIETRMRELIRMSITKC